MFSTYKKKPPRISLSGFLFCLKSYLFNFEAVTTTITKAKVPRVFRILRLASLASHNDVTKICPAEIFSYLSANYSNIIAKFAVNIVNSNNSNSQPRGSGVAQRNIEKYITVFFFSFRFTVLIVLQ